MDLLVPAARIERWVANFEARHGDTALEVRDRCLYGEAVDGSWFSAAAPFGRGVDAAEVGALMAACSPPEDWGILLVRKGGFAVARLAGEETVESKVGQRHVQGRSKAGGQSQQRFARRRDNQARAAYEAAADHAARILADVPVLVVGGDHTAVDEVLGDRRLSRAVAGRCGRFLAVPDPRRAVLESAVGDACAARVNVMNS